jgi:hypothetical protein
VRRLAVLALVALSAVSADARPLKGQGPTTIANGYGAVWVGFGDGTVTRVDERTLALRSRRLGRAGHSYILSIATGAASVWVAPSGLAVHRLDPRTVTVRGTVRNQPGVWTGAGTQVVVGAGFAWIADHERNAVLHASLRTNRVARRTVVHGRLRSIAAGAREVWVQVVPTVGPIRGPEGTRVVSRLDPRTMRLRRAFRTSCDSSLLPTGQSLWVLDNCDGTLRRFDVRAGRLSTPLAVSGTWGLSAGFGSLWVSGGTTVRRVSDGRVVAAIPARGLAAAGQIFVWVLDMGDGVTGWLRRVDPATNRLVGRPIRLSARQ